MKTDMGGGVICFVLFHRFLKFFHDNNDATKELGKYGILTDFALCIYNLLSFNIF